MTIQAVVFDIGGVLEITPETGTIEKWEERLHMKPGELDERLRSAWGRDGDIGRRSEEEPSIADIQAALHGHSSQKERVQKG